MSGWQAIRFGLTQLPELRKGLALTVVFGLVATVGRTAIPITVQRLIDALTGPTPKLGAHELGILSLGATAVVLTALAAATVITRLVTAAERGLYQLRVAAFTHLHRLSLATQSTEQRGNLVARVTSDVDVVSEFLSHNGITVLFNGGQILVVTAVMAAYSWQLTLVVWLIVPPTLWVLARLRRVVAAQQRLTRERVGTLSAQLGEAVVGMPVLAAYGAQRQTQHRLADTITAQYRASFRSHLFSSISTSLTDVAMGVASAAVLAVGIVLGANGQLSLGQLLAFIFLLTMLMTPLQMGVEVLNEAQRALAGWRRVCEVLQLPVELADPGAEVTLPAGALGLHCDRVSYAYPGGPTVLHEVSVDIPAGARIAVVGETGSGKSSFARLLVRLADPTQGEIRLGELSLRQIPFPQLRRAVTLVPQEGFLFATTVRENLRMGLPDEWVDAAPEMVDARLHATIAALDLADWFATLPDGLDTRVGERGQALSAGERQLLALVMAALVDPQVLVLDEATSAVDPATDVRIHHALTKLAVGRTVVVVAHRLATALTADQVLVFDEGRIVQRGTHAELVATPGPYATLHQIWLSHT